MKLVAALVALALVAAEEAGAKPGTPGPAYFSGSYERIGRGGGRGVPALLDDRVTITPAGKAVTIRACSGPELLMQFGPAFEVDNLMTGAQDGVAVECLFGNNGYNRPILTCRAADGAAFTLWPLSVAPLDCDG